jgi:formylglycine-generating enzyme required for sulfatase activity
LVAACWGGRAVSEDAINRSISVIRRLADAHGSYQIETVARVGYRLRAVLAGDAGEPLDEDPTRRARPISASAVRWARIERSLDPEDYADFLAVFPQAEEAFDARRQKRQVEAWAEVDQADPLAVAAFLESGSFAALQTAAQTVADNLAAAAAKARRLLSPIVLLADAARAAALANRALPDRSFRIDLDAGGWPYVVMVAIPPGRFLIGASDDEIRHAAYEGAERPQHEVKIEHVFALGREPISVAAFAAFVDDTGYDAGDIAVVVRDGRYVNERGRSWRDPGFSQDSNHPATCISWQDSQAFIAWLNSRLTLTGRPDAYRLPSESEWEYACRAGTQTPFNFGATITPHQANYDGRGSYDSAAPSLLWRRATTPQDSFSENAFGLFDMHGNVWEKCEDRWHWTYDGAPSDGSAWIADGRKVPMDLPYLRGDLHDNVVRGGGWETLPQFLRSAYRLGVNASLRHAAGGFRIARTLLPPAD